MNLDQLEAVETILACGSFRAAAKKLRRSQPALSASIKNLEEEFDLKIFDRSSYRPVLTESGVIFLEAAQKTLESARYTIRVAQELGQKKIETKLRVALDPLTPLDAIECIALECSRPMIPVALILERTILHHSHVQLLEGKVDLALAASVSHTGIESLPLASASLRGVVSRKLLQEKRQADADFLQKHSQILIYDKDFQESPDAQPNSLRKGAGAKIFVPDHFTKLRLIEGGLGWGRLAENEIGLNKDLVVIDPKICTPLSLELSLLRAKNRAIGPIARAIWRVFQKRVENKGVKQ